MDQLEPDKVTGESHDDRLVEQGESNGQVDCRDPSRLKDQTHDEKNRNGEDQLVEKGVDGMDLRSHEPLDVERCGALKEGCENLEGVPQEHGRLCSTWLPLKDHGDPQEGQHEADGFQEGETVILQKEMGA